MSILEVSGLSKRFGGLQAVNDVSFSVDRGQVLGLIGPNGSGKSTTLSLLMGVVRPDRGKIQMEGVDIAGWRTHRIAKQGMAMVFQHSRPLARQTVLENIKLALLPDTLFQLFPPHTLDRRAHEIAERVGLAKVVNEHPGELPFADLRRLEIAKALAQDPAVLLLDEPFAGLAPSETREFAELVRLFREEDRAVILVDHNVKEVAGLVDNIVAMHAGKRIAMGSPEEVTRDPHVREVYFGSSLESASGVHAAGDRRAQSGSDRPLLEVELRSVRYGLAEALRNVRLQVNDGECVSVVGINGAGKSTLFKSILDFLPYEGVVRWQGQAVTGNGPGAVASSGIALCPETRELFRYMSVRENLELGGHRLDNQEREAQLERVFDLFPVLRQRQAQAADTLSGGEQQQLTIGRALMQKPRLLILDEPTLGLAPLIIENISEALERLQRETGLAILLGEQNLTFALRHSERVYLLETGNLRWQGKAENFVAEVGEDVL
ncbi:ATP-binding cassette domain-containing protein [Mangrovitalea sediminis]|uniref:ATP-binding cassette domain-containing protein n=1 Tax=Mangrovitalea sediminis TaxID=1982043 RepID=UPI000BE617CE|nr:ATP-binding cassette domain-containing protein [Mangrovitalea sediminis]